MAEAGRQRFPSRLLAHPFALDNPAHPVAPALGQVIAVGWMEAQPGDTWPGRWLASGPAVGQAGWPELVTSWGAVRPVPDGRRRCSPAPPNRAAEMGCYGQVRTQVVGIP